MERAAAYGPWPTERPRLVVVKDGGASYSALPHDVMRDTSLSRDARLLYAVLQGHWWQTGECFASHATLADEMGCSTRMLRTYLTELVSTGRVTEEEAGTRRQKVYRAGSIGTVLPIEPANEQPDSDWNASNRKFSTVQSEISDTGNRKQASYSYKKTPEKKTKEENRDIPESPVAVVAGASSATATEATKPKGVKVAFGSLSETARLVVDDWRQKQGRPRPPQFNPTQAAYLEEAIADLGVERLLEGNTWAAQNGVPEFVKAIRAARTKRQRDEDDGVSVAPAAPQVNGTASKVIPVTEGDRAVWDLALVSLRGFMNAANFESYIEPLEVGGRLDTGGLCLIVPSGVGPSVARFKTGIHRALMDAGDPAPTAVAFKARRSSREQSHAE